MLVINTLLFLLSISLKLGSCQEFPSPDIFLSWLFDTASTEIESLAENFVFLNVEPEDVTFINYSSRNQTILNVTNPDLNNLEKPLKIVIHGWQASGTDDVNKKLADAYHEKGSYHVIAIDWSKHSKRDYLHSSSSTKNVGHIVANFILNLIEKNVTLFENIHLIGHSLGAHVASFAGKKIKNETGFNIGRITGLDVAAPLFEMPRKRPENMRLNRNDADFVDVIHTNVGFLGFGEAIGTCDFYVENGGPLQPGCFNPLNMVDSIACSHFKAFEYFMDTVKGKVLEAVSCLNSIQYYILACNDNKKIIVGEDVPKSAKGSYYLEAKSALPYVKIPDIPFPFDILT